VLNDALIRFPATAIRDEMGPREDRSSAVLRQVLVGERTSEITRLRPCDLQLPNARSATRVHFMVRSIVLVTADRSAFCSPPV